MWRRQPVFLCFGLDSIDSAQASSSLTLLGTSNTVKAALDFPGLGNNNLKLTRSLVCGGREVNADGLETKSSRSKDTNVLLSMPDAISHPPVRHLSGILASSPQHCNQRQYHFFCRFASDWAREIAPDARAIHTI